MSHWILPLIFICLNPQVALQRACVHVSAEDNNCPRGQYAFSSSSCVSHGALTDQIASLEDRAPLPSQILKDYPTTEIAQALVYRLFQRHDLKDSGLNDFLFPSLDFFHQGEIQLAFFSKYAASIFKNGFLNQHQRGSSSGHYRPGQRALLEDKMIGLTIEENYSTIDQLRPANELRPKYAFLGLPANAPGVEPGLFEIDYGDVFAVFKEEVKQRATFSNGDSLNNESSDKLEKHTFKYFRNKLFFPRLGNYYEVQIWGKLTLDDVAYFLVNCPGFYDTDEAFFEAYKEAGLKIPVYPCSSVDPVGAGGARSITTGFR